MNAPINIPRLTAIGSGKGGTGKTLLAVSLAHALAYCGERVLLCDADLGLSNAAVHLGLEHGGDLVNVMAGNCAVEDGIVPVLGGISARGGFDLLSAPPGSGSLANTDAAAATRLLMILRAAHAYDRVLLDLGAGVDETTMNFASCADETLLVMTSDPAALTDAYAFSKLLARAAPGRTPLVLVNLATNETEAHRTFKALAATSRAFLKSEPHHLASIPRDPKAAEAVRRQCHLLTLYPQAPASRAIDAAAQQLHARMEVTAGPAPRAGMR